MIYYIWYIILYDLLYYIVYNISYFYANILITFALGY
jgi:hypothetical protein